MEFFKRMYLYLLVGALGMLFAKGVGEEFLKGLRSTGGYLKATDIMECQFLFPIAGGCLGCFVVYLYFRFTKP